MIASATGMTLAQAPTAAGLARIHAACFAGGESWDEAAMSTLLGMPGCFACLAGDCGLAMARVAADEAELLTIAVCPAARRSGIGAALLCHVSHRAFDLGASRLFLEVSPANHAALALYRSTGFAVVGRRRAYYRDGADAMLLARALPFSSCGSTPA